MTWGLEAMSCGALFTHISSAKIKLRVCRRSTSKGFVPRMNDTIDLSIPSV